MDVKKLSVPIVAVLCSLIIGVFYTSTQVIKQRSIEKQVQMKIDQENSERIANEAKDVQEKADKEFAENLRQRMITACFQDEFSNYDANWKGECKSRQLKEDCSLPTLIANRLEDNLKESKDNCLKRYNK